jgi:hypothetical protein
MFPLSSSEIGRITVLLFVVQNYHTTTKTTHNSRASISMWPKVPKTELQ